MRLTNKELKNIVGGAAFGWIAAGIIAGVSFLIGIFDGYTRPYKCR